MPLDFGTVPAGSFVREKSRLRLYSASGFVARLEVVLVVDFFADDFFADDFFAAGLLAEAFFVEAFFTEGFLAEVVFALLFFVTGRFTVRLRVVAMLASWCEEHARG